MGYDGVWRANVALLARTHALGGLGKCFTRYGHGREGILKSNDLFFLCQLLFLIIFTSHPFENR
jgi:hypothetical protein